LIQPEALLNMIEQVPHNVLVLLDEAYYEYLAPQVAPQSIAWLARFPNLLIARTFSKAYGLAGLRVGFGLAHPSVVDMLNRVRQPFNVSSVAQAAALAALGDRAHLQRSVELNARGMQQICAGLNRLGLTYIPSFGNFVSFRIGGATAMYQRLLKRGIIVRPVANYGMPDYLRVSIGLETENDKFLSALASAMQE
jgi:histidinol-phosphate aminotransferase